MSGLEYDIQLVFTLLTKISKMSWQHLTVVFIITTINALKSKPLLSPIVNVEQGMVQGTIKSTYSNRSFYAFQGIPYGKSPTGPLRFKAPQRAEKWPGVLRVDSDPPLCTQMSNIFFSTGVEDCLQLNVFTPNLPNIIFKPSFPVLVFIHGGGFLKGNIEYTSNNPERYINYDIIVVTMNYRLGALGFLSTNDKAASGNYGLLDQNLALKWIKNNIAAFGGNPNNITLSGQSAGGASVIYQLLSPMSSGLFNKAIAESGTALSQWTLQKDPLYFAKAMGANFHCPTHNTTGLINCLRKQKAEDIVVYSFRLAVKNLTLCFVPNVENSSNGLFLTEGPLTLLQTGNFNKVPLQLGFDRDEAIFEIPFIDFSGNIFNVVVPSLLQVLSNYRTNLVNVSYAIREKYYKDVDYKNQTQVNIATIKWMSDITMKSGIAQTAALVSSHNVPTYLYAFNYVSNTSTSNYTGEPDIDHGAEMQYLWYTNVRNTRDVDFGRRFFKLWTDFIFTGEHPQMTGKGSTWLPTPPGQYNYYDIQDVFTMKGSYDPSAMKFWWNEVPEIVNKSGIRIPNEILHPFHNPLETILYIYNRISN